MKNILLFKIGAIGDVFMTTPFIRQLKKQNPHCVLDYMIWSKTTIIIQWNPYIHKYIPFDESWFTSKNMFSLLSFFRKIKKIKNNYDTVVIFDKHWIFGLLFKIAGFKKRIWFDRAYKDWKFLTNSLPRNASKREVEYNLELLTLLWYIPDYSDQKYDMNIEPHNSAIDDLVKRLKTSSKKLIWISTWWGNTITNTLHGDKDCRRWSLDNRTTLTKKLLEKWYIVLLLWVVSDRKLSIQHPDFYDFLWKYTIKESIYLISKLDNIVCQESWFMHLVWCTKTSMIVLAWPTNPHRFYPYNHPWTIFWKVDKECYGLYWEFDACTGKEIDKISVDNVINSL